MEADDKNPAVSTNEITYIFTDPGCGDGFKTHTVREWLGSVKQPGAPHKIPAFYTPSIQKTWYHFSWGLYGENLEDFKWEMGSNIPADEGA